MVERGEGQVGRLEKICGWFGLVGLVWLVWLVWLVGLVGFVCLFVVVVNVVATNQHRCLLLVVPCRSWLLLRWFVGCCLGILLAYFCASRQLLRIRAFEVVGKWGELSLES